MRAKTRKLVLNLATGAAIAATAAVVFTPAVAFAAPATATTNVNVRATPGGAVVDTLRAGQPVDVGECRGSWCYVTKPGPDGWVSANYLSRGGSGGGLVGPVNPTPGFGIEVGPGGVSIGIGTPRPLPPPVIERPRRIAEVCFYERSNYRGQSFCLEEGESTRVNRRWEQLASFDNPDRARVRLCADTRRGSDCRVYTSGSRNLGDFGFDVTSIRVD